jgi:hypothetical protein
MTTQKHDELLEDFISNLHREDFYEAHESLEKIWFPRRFEKSDEINLIKGFINAAVSFELLKKGRVEASEKVYKIYEKYKNLIHNIDSPHLNKYTLIAELLQSIKDSQPS